MIVSGHDRRRQLPSPVLVSMAESKLSYILDSTGGIGLQFFISVIMSIKGEIHH
jgi:hypothetical protein